MQKPDLSVIIPAYNCAECIGACLDSIVIQDCFTKSQIIVIDDGSKDNTADVVQTYSLRFPNIELYKQKNSGVSAARNHGLDVARGEFISFVDADDMVGAVYENCEPYLGDVASPFYCEDMKIIFGQFQNKPPKKPLGDNKYFSRMIKSARINNAEIAMGGEITIDGKKYDMSILRYMKNGILTDSIADKRSAIEQSENRESANFAVYHRDFLTQHNLRFQPDMSLDEDILFCMLATLYARRISTVQDSLYFYKRRPGSLTDYASQMPPRESERKFSAATIQRYGCFLLDIADKPQYAAIYQKYMRKFCSESYAAIRAHKKYFPRGCAFCSCKSCEGCELNTDNIKRVERGLKKLMPNRVRTK